MVAVPQPSSSATSQGYADRLQHAFEQTSSRRRSIWSLTGSVDGSIDANDDGLQQQTDIEPEGKEDASMKEESDGEDQQDDWTLDVSGATDAKASVPECPEQSIAMALACMAE